MLSQSAIKEDEDSVDREPLPTTTDPAQSSDFDAVIVGAGFAGLYMLHRLRGLGLSARVFEAGGGIGGTWYWNRYPGARCDVESMDYSYSFSDELQQEWHWTERYASQPEILRYINHVADRFDLRRDIQLETRVTAARFDEAANRWQIETDRGDHVSARFCIMATGCLSSAQIPAFPGLESFAGTTYHTGHWPHTDVDFTGQRVGVIGTGSSAIQSIPIIARQAASLVVFQRTPNFSVPARNGPLDPEYERRVKADYAEFRRQARESRVGFVVPVNDAVGPGGVRQRSGSASTRCAGNAAASASPRRSPTCSLGKEANDTAAEFFRAKIRAIGPRPGGRRGARSQGLSARHQAHLRRHRLLRDVQPRQRHPGRSPQRADRGDHPTRCAHPGHRVRARQHRLRHRLRRHDRRPAQHRHPRPGRQHAAAEVGRRAAHLPRARHRRLSEPLHHHRARQPVRAQQHDRVHRAARRLDRRLPRAPAAHGTSQTIEATAEAEDAWVAHVNEVANATLYPLANSWYIGANIPGKPRIFMPYVGGVGAYRKNCDDVAARDYEGFKLTG